MPMVLSISGTNLPMKQYANCYHHETSGLNFAIFRTYDSNKGRWLSRDWAEENGGLNLYDYVENMPIVDNDPSGLAAPGTFDIHTYPNGTGGNRSLNVTITYNDCSDCNLICHEDRACDHFLYLTHIFIDHQVPNDSYL
jgi:RHS repeat-associated protein